MACHWSDNKPSLTNCSIESPFFEIRQALDEGTSYESFPHRSSG